MKLRLPVREIVFGLEDSLVSTSGVVVGIAAGTDNRYLVILSAIIVIVVESLSMAAGTFLSNKSEMEMAHKSPKNTNKKSLVDSLYMGLSYVIGGLISTLPFLFFTVRSAIIYVLVFSTSALFLIGYIKGWVVGTNKWKSGLEMSLVSLSAAALGYFIGKFVSPLITK